MKKTVLREYAKLIAKTGVNVQKGQEVFIQAELDQPEFVAMVVDECYKLKAKKVVVDWSYQPLTKLHVRYRSLKTLSTLDNYEEARWQHYVDTIPCRIYLISEDPDGLRGVNQEKMAKSQQAKYPIIKGYRDQIENKYQWCIAAVPGEKWAKKLFPELRASQAVEKLWEAILKTSRVTGDPIQAWEEHNKDLHDRCQYLNSLHIRELRYKSSNGTDFTVGLAKNHVWEGGASLTPDGRSFVPNMPTEEVFTAPDRFSAEGTLAASLPLSHGGALIENFTITFHEGRAVSFTAEKGGEALQSILDTDEGAKYLGEVALIPADSPISRMGLLFYNTLFDENASCHFALGAAYPENVEGGMEMSKEELKEAGLNDSLTHVDFMIGTADLEITGIRADGSEIPVFRRGVWAR